MKTSTLFARLLLVSSFTLLSSCSWFDFLSDDDEELQPNELVDFDEEVELRRVWSTNIGSGQGDKFNRLKPAIGAGRIYAASNDGLVVALDLEDGDRVWRRDLSDGAGLRFWRRGDDDNAITGGVGFGGGLVLVGTENSQVIALDAETGDVRWEATVSSEVLSAPATNGRVVVAQTVDGKLTGLDANTGMQLWLYETTVPALSLRGNSSPLIVDNFVIAAFADGSVASVALDNGTLRWDERVAIPTGRSEIDRLVDIDGDLVIGDNNQLLVPSYQGYLAAIDVVTGQTRWRVEESSDVGASFGFGNIYAVNEDDIVRAYRLTQETPVWENNNLLRRGLSAPQGFSNYVAVADYEGYVHLLAQSDGRFVGRARVDGDGVRARMLSQGNTLYVYGNSGDLAALRVETE